jgi:hypothetical protein
MKNLRTLLAISVLAFTSLSAQAEIISVDDWWLQTDNLGGLRQSTYAPDFYFAVSDSNVWSPTAIYEAMDGYRVATTAEGQAVFNSNNNSGERTYYNQGGWNGFNWEGKTRTSFRFSDSASTGAYKHLSLSDQYLVLLGHDGVTNFAGMVMIREQNSTSSSTLADVPAPVGIAALAFAGLMLMRRRKI